MEICFMHSYPPARYVLIFLLLLPAAGFGAEEEQILKKSAYYAYVGRDYIFTIEMIDPGTPLLNFVSMLDQEGKLQAKNIRLSLGNRRAAAELFVVEPDQKQDPILVSSMQIRPRSSFGFRLDGKFGTVRELYGAEIKLGEDTFKLAPLTNIDFEILVDKVNRLNLVSPDFRDDFRVLNLGLMGNRSSSRR
jgi:hypothetical protein